MFSDFDVTRVTNLHVSFIITFRVFVSMLTKYLQFCYSEPFQCASDHHLVIILGTGQKPTRQKPTRQNPTRQKPTRHKPTLFFHQKFLSYCMIRPEGFRCCRPVASVSPVCLLCEFYRYAACTVGSSPLEVVQRSKTDLGVTQHATVSAGFMSQSDAAPRHTHAQYINSSHTPRER